MRIAIWWCEMVREATVEASSGSSDVGTNCTGLLYFSSTFCKKKNTQPLCVGLSRRVVHKGDNSRKEVAKHGQALRDFKYACIGQSLYHNDQLANQLASGSIRESDLPLCDGLKIVEGKNAAKKGQLNKNNQQRKEDVQAIPRPPTQTPPPTSVKGGTPEDFGTRFVRSAGLVASELKQNAYDVGNYVKTLVEDIFHSGGSRSK